MLPWLFAGFYERIHAHWMSQDRYIIDTEVPHFLRGFLVGNIFNENLHIVVMGLLNQFFGPFVLVLY